MTSTQARVTAAFPTVAWQLDQPLVPLSYFKLGGAAEMYLETADLELLRNIFLFCREHAIPFRVIGGLSNVIIADAGVVGVVIRLTYNQLTLGEQNSRGTVVTAGAGTKMATLVAWTVSQGLTGLEFFLGVPGMLGGAVCNNAHYLSALISEHIEQVRIINTRGELEWLAHDVCDFGYDHSRFQSSQEIIVEVIFRLQVGDKNESKALIARATTYRAQTQPLGVPSSGCIFQNVPNSPALQQQFPQFADKTHVPGGFLIDQAGLKGLRMGSLEVSPKHAAFIVNHGGGTASELLALIKIVKERVSAAFGVELREEVFFLS